MAAILSVVESCRRLRIPVRDYLAEVLPGLADRAASEVGVLTPMAWQRRRLEWPERPGGRKAGVGKTLTMVRARQPWTGSAGRSLAEWPIQILSYKSESSETGIHREAIRPDGAHRTTFSQWVDDPSGSLLPAKRASL